jgi:hypothetical protein
MHSAAIPVRFLDDTPERFFEIGFALSNSAPPDAVQIRFVN